MNHTQCVYPGCTSTRRTRGLCHGHYQAMRTAVRATGKELSCGAADAMLVHEGCLMVRGLLLAKGKGGGPKVGKCPAFQLGSTVLGDANSLSPERIKESWREPNH